MNRRKWKRKILGKSKERQREQDKDKIIQVIFGELKLVLLLLFLTMRYYQATQQDKYFCALFECSFYFK